MIKFMSYMLPDTNTRYVAKRSKVWLWKIYNVSSVCACGLFCWLRADTANVDVNVHIQSEAHFDNISLERQDEDQKYRLIIQIHVT